MFDQIGEVLSARRRELGLSQSELAEALSLRGLSVTNQAVSKWEKGATLPNARQLLVLCQVLEIEDIRGVVTSKGTLDVLLETGWIKPRGRRKTPGEDGEKDDYRDGFRALKELGYQGFVSFECGCEGDRKVVLPAAVELLRKQWEEA